MTSFDKMGRAALIPGMQYMLDEMQQLLDKFREYLNGEEPKKRGPKAGSLSTYWSKMTPEERSAEMVRRMNKRKKTLHPRDVNHPDHQAWVEKMRKVSKASWNSLTAAQKKARLAQMRKGKAA